MTLEELQALREKHQVVLWGADNWEEMCLACLVFYPCDVIQVLDAWEQA